MLFNSFDFAVFFPVFFLLYWFVFQRSIRYQNLLVVVGSYLFYGWWDWRFLGLLMLSTGVDFLVSRGLQQSEQPLRRKGLLGISLAFNLGMLGYFKYSNFFLESFLDAFTFMGMPFEARTLSIVLPVGISFYTFQTLSYTLDVYRRRMEPSRDFVSFVAFVSFFPQLVAGPIERASDLLPQFSRERSFQMQAAVDGLRLILWGFFKKLVIADNCAGPANYIFNHSADLSGSTLALGAFYFAFQIYGDFSGYSDIAIGSARLLGFNLKRNFHFPYFSRDMAEFWRRWHISLSSWFRDYLYVPLGGSRGSKLQTIRNVFIIFLVSGFWHGANWTFIAWGALNAAFFLPVLLLDNNRKHLDVPAAQRVLPNLRETGSMALTFVLTCVAWIFFRSESLAHAMAILKEIASPSLLTMPRFMYMVDGFITLMLIAFFLLVEWTARRNHHALEKMEWLPSRPLRYGFYYLLLGLILWFGGKEQVFIYFQF